MLRKIRILLFDPSPIKEPGVATAAINMEEVSLITPAEWTVTKWLEGKPCSWLTLKNGQKVCAIGKVEDFIEEEVGDE